MPASTTVSESTGHGTVFANILCAVNGSRGSAAAVRQALALASDESTVTFVAVTDERGTGPNQMASLGEHRARQTLAAARALVREANVSATVELVHCGDIAGMLLALAAHHDLLVLGSHARSRLGGFLTGSVATTIAHRAQNPFLVARDGESTSGAFPQHILIGAEGLWRARRQVELGAHLAAATGAHVHLAHVVDRRDDERSRRTPADLTVRALEITGTEPLVEVLTGPADEVLVREAERVGADLLVLGRRGVMGLEALGSVSERVVNRAPCSVLVLGPGD